jgi:dephospho-CoA kinase
LNSTGAKVIIIGAVGKNGSGKDEVLKYLRTKYSIPFLSTGDIVRGIASEQGLESTRTILQEISEKYFKQYGQGCFVKMAAEQIQKNGWPVSGISGIRSLNDVTILKTMLGANFILVNVYITDPRERYSRMVKRGEARDPRNYEQFLMLDQNEEKIFHVQEAAKQADYSLTNDGALDDLHIAIDLLVSAGKLPIK